MTLEQVITKAVRYFTPESLIGAVVYCADTLEELRDKIVSDESHAIVEIVTEIYSDSKYKFSVTTGLCWKYAVPKFVIDDWKRNQEECMTLKSSYFTSRYGRSSSLRSGFLSEEEINKNFRLFANGEPLSEVTCLDILTNKPSKLIIKLAKEKNMNAVKVNYYNDMTERFEGKDYIYLIEGEYKKGDFLVFRNYNSQITVIKVVDFITDLDTLDQDIKYKEMTVLGIADMSAYQAIVDNEEKEARKEEIMSELESKFEEANKMALYKELAKKDENMASLLKELEELNK